MVIKPNSNLFLEPIVLSFEGDVSCKNKMGFGRFELRRIIFAGH